MKAKRRHELQENVLASELAKTVEFFKKRGTYIAWGLLVAALVVLVVVYSRSKTQQRARQIQNKYDRLVAKQLGPRVNLEDQLAGFKSLAEQEVNRRIAADACVLVAATYVRQAGAGGLTAAALMLESPLEQANQYYRRVIDEFPDQPVAVAKAHFGLGKLAEADGDLETAKAKYEAVVAMAGQLAGQPILNEARAAIDVLDSLGEPVRMASTAPAEPATAPAVPAGEAGADVEIEERTAE